MVTPEGEPTGRKQHWSGDASPFGRAGDDRPQHHDGGHDRQVRPRHVISPDWPQWPFEGPSTGLIPRRNDHPIETIATGGTQRSKKRDSELTKVVRSSQVRSRPTSTCFACAAENT